MSKKNIAKFELEDIKNEYLKRWINLLCCNEMRYNQFVDEFLDRDNIFHSACRYQSYLRNEKTQGRDFEEKRLKKAVDNGDKKVLNLFLQEIFIEPIDDEAVEQFVNLVKGEKLELTRFIDTYKNNKDKGFWLTLKKTM